MKLIIRDYLASLKEREELDAILPDLLSEIGFTVYSRPKRGTTQHGVDIAAVGPDEHGEARIFLFSVKQGDLNRQDWDGTPQSLRSSLNEIRDAYIPSRIPPEYGALKIVICLCFGGDIHENVRSAVTGYTSQNRTDRISYEEWNGDKIAGLILHGVLREEILPKPLRTSFQKAVALVDEPDVSYHHFALLLARLLEVNKGANAPVRTGRQLYICLWILFVWARDIDNLEAPYRASELALLNIWHLLRPYIDKDTKEAKAMAEILSQLISLHIAIATSFLETKILPFAEKLHAISTAIESRHAVDVNLKLFDLLGRISMTHMWLLWLAQEGGTANDPQTKQKLSDLTTYGFRLIQNNPTLFSPICDQHSIEIALFLMAASHSEANPQDVRNWLGKMVNHISFTTRTQGKYPCVFTDYRELIDHPRERTDEYFQSATCGSTLLPLIAAWLLAMGVQDAFSKLCKLVRDKLQHCTMQLWLPDSASEEQLYIGDRDHGVSLTNLELRPDGNRLLQTIAETCKKEDGLDQLSAVRTGYWPIVMLACRHHRFPLPPHFWIEILHPGDA